MNMMMAAGEKMAKFMREKNGHERESKGKAAEKGSRIAVEECEGANELVNRDGLVVSVGGGELRTGSEACAKSQ